MGVIDDYLASVEPSKRRQLQRIRELANLYVPDARETISYKMPTLTYRGEPFLGFAARAGHIGIYPFGGRVVSELEAELSGYAVSKGTIRVPFDRPIPERLLEAVIACRLEAIRAGLHPKLSKRTK